MVDSVSSSSSSSSSSSTSSATTSADSTYDMFLQLLVTQLQNQNPLDPMDPTEFTEQLATYSSLEQQIETNDSLSDILSQLQSSSSALANGTGYIGRTVDADTDTLNVADDGTVTADWRYTLDSDATSVTLKIVDADGNTVWSGTGETAEGSHTLDWDGKDSDGDTVSAGEYTLEVTATDADGEDITSSISIRGAVTAVDSSDGDTILELGDTQIDIDDVTRVAA